MSSDRSSRSQSSTDGYVTGWSKRRIPPLSTNTNGYEFFSCRVGGRYDTVYVHQLCAIAGGADPHDVFGDGSHTYHRCPIPWLNTPENIGVISQWEHQEKRHRAELPASGSTD